MKEGNKGNLSSNSRDSNVPNTVFSVSAFVSSVSTSFHPVWLSYKISRRSFGYGYVDSPLAKGLIIHLTGK